MGAGQGNESTPSHKEGWKKKGRAIRIQQMPELLITERVRRDVVFCEIAGKPRQRKISEEKKNK